MDFLRGLSGDAALSNENGEGNKDMEETSDLRAALDADRSELNRVAILRATLMQLYRKRMSRI